MIKVYSASDPLQAHVLRGALEAAGIEAVVRGDFLFTMRGEAPVTSETLPTVWIVSEDDLPAAEPIVRAFDAKAPAGPTETWVCRQCGEVSEASFDQCWKCGSGR